MVGEEGLEPPHVKTSAIYSRGLAVEDFIKPCLAFACVYLFRHSRNIKVVWAVGFEPTNSLSNMEIAV